MHKDWRDRRSEAYQDDGRLPRWVVVVFCLPGVFLLFLVLVGGGLGAVVSVVGMQERYLPVPWSEEVSWAMRWGGMVLHLLGCGLCMLWWMGVLRLKLARCGWSRNEWTFSMVSVGMASLGNGWSMPMYIQFAFTADAGQLGSWGVPTSMAFGSIGFLLVLYRLGKAIQEIFAKHRIGADLQHSLSVIFLGRTGLLSFDRALHLQW